VHGLWKHGPIPVIGLVGGIGAGKSAVAEALARRGAFVLDADRVGHALLDQPPARDRVVRRFGPEILADPSAEPEAVAPADADALTDANTDPDSDPATELDADTEANPGTDACAESEAGTGTDAGKQAEPRARGKARANAGPPIDRKALGAIVFADGSARRDLEAILHPRMRATFERAIDRTIRRGGHKAIILDAALLYEAGWDELCDLVVFVDAPTSQRVDRVKSTRGWTAAELATREAAQMSLEKKRERADAVLENNSTPQLLDERVGALWSRRLSPRSRYRPDAFE
jgi:dephospho-CoA kinase